MSQFVTLNRIMKDDYHYNEAIKTLRTKYNSVEAVLRQSC